MSVYLSIYLSVCLSVCLSVHALVLGACRFELHHQHPDTRKAVLWGGSCMALLQGDSRQAGAACLVGTEGGAVFRCSLETNAASLQAFAQVSSPSFKSNSWSPC